MRSAVVYRQFSSKVHIAGDVTKHLAIRAVLFDCHVLCSDAKLQKRTNLTNIDNNIKISDTMKVKDDKIDKNAKDTAKYDKIEGFSNVQSKYMEKLRNKIGSVGRAELVANSKKGIVEDTLNKSNDASLLNQARTSLNQSNNQNEQHDNTSGSQEALGWLLKPGMGAVVDYIKFRSIRLGLLMDGASSLVRNTLSSQLSAAYSSIEEKKEDDEDYEEESVFNVLKQLGVSPEKVLVISNRDNILAEAANLNAHTCRFRGKNDLHGKITTHFKVSSALEIQDCIDNISGIAFRKSAHDSRIFH